MRKPSARWRRSPPTTRSTKDRTGQSYQLRPSATVTGNPETAKGIVGKLRAGLVAVNQWGGVKGGAFGGLQSGNGREGVATAQGLHGNQDDRIA
jgi:hypothetical protein